MGKEHMKKGAHHGKCDNADLSGLRGADHRDGGQGRPAWPEPLNLEPDIGDPHLRPTDAVLVDPLMTIEQGMDVADWVSTTGKNLRG
jgi:hypothetical protein